MVPDTQARAETGSSWRARAGSLARSGTALGACVVVVALLACKLPRQERGPAGDVSAGGVARAPHDLSSAAGIRAWAAETDCAVGSGELVTAEAHDGNGMGSMVVAHRVDEKVVKIVRRTELAPPTVSTGFYFAGDELVLAETRTTDVIEGAPPARDRRFYRGGRLIHREGRPEGDDDTQRARGDLTVAAALLRGVREREPDIRLPAAVF